MLRTLKNTLSKLKYMKTSESVKIKKVTIHHWLKCAHYHLKIRYKHARIKGSDLIKIVVTGLEI